ISEHGPVTAATLAEHLGLTAAAVRRHLDTLLELDLVASREVAVAHRGRGRSVLAVLSSDKLNTDVT
ncbi:MAG TPA: helix-turn-helix domain-containing protein, partial [Pedococcus sp.]